MKASRSLLFVVASRLSYASKIRPSTKSPTAISSGKEALEHNRSSGGNSSRRWGLFFLLGGLAIASWVAKPNKRQPTAAIDSFKPRVAVVFVFGSSKDAAREFASEHNFGYVSEPSETAVANLVDNGCTKLIIDNMDPKSAGKFEDSVVACDVALNYTGNSLPELASTGRVVDMPNTTIDEVLADRNLI